MADSIGTLRLCAGCAIPLVRRHDERNGQWVIRRFCSAHCWDTHRPVTNPKATGRIRANNLYPGEPCEVCGKPYGGRGNVQRHHIDGDTMNNARSNIAFLCTTHHMQAHKERDGHGPGGGPRPRVAAARRAEAIARYREALPLREAGLTLEEIGERMGYSRSAVGRWLHKYDETA